MPAPLVVGEKEVGRARFREDREWSRKTGWDANKKTQTLQVGKPTEVALRADAGGDMYAAMASLKETLGGSRGHLGGYFGRLHHPRTPQGVRFGA